MSEQRLKVQSGPPDEMYSDDHLDASPPADAPTTTEEAKGRAQEVAGQAKDRAAAEVDARSTQAGEQIGAQAEAIDGVAEELRRQGKEGPAKIAEQASERVKGVADHLQQADGESLVSAAADIARENPAAAAAAGVAAGFVAGRVIKAATGDAPAEEHDVPGRQGDGAA